MQRRPLSPRAIVTCHDNDLGQCEIHRGYKEERWLNSDDTDCEEMRWRVKIFVSRNIITNGSVEANRTAFIMYVQIISMTNKYF